ncbi:MAG: SGNH/GDSL hydrolase family protein [Desulfovibrionaceae bacterium]|nr:SGNH/GDSL hydrolase family protein [Desulfovibrionaceae bacterium]MBF0513596.1 SGNH/GDSL hydrolase family protein [Desulfovibrionaceae bacterium]
MPKEKSPFFSALINYTLAIFSIFFILFLAEITCRYLFPYPSKKLEIGILDFGLWSTSLFAEKDPLLGYHLKKNIKFKEYQFNSLGFRNAEFSKSKPNDVYRIICIGGSTTFGTDCGGNQYTYPALLQDIFKDKLGNCGKKIEVINAGVIGYHSMHSLIRFKNELINYSPDLIIVMDGLNDIVVAEATTENELKDFSTRTNNLLVKLINTHMILEKLDTICSRLNIYLWVKDFSKHLKKSNHPLEKINTFRGKEYAEYSKEMEEKISLLGYKNNTEQLIEFAKENNIDSLVVTYPFALKSDFLLQQEKNRLFFLNFNKDEYFLWRFGRNYLQKTNMDIAKNTGAPVVNLQEIFDNATENATSVRRIYSDMVHFTRIGNMIAAKSIFNSLVHTEKLRSFLGSCSLSFNNNNDYTRPDIDLWGENILYKSWPPNLDLNPDVRIKSIQNIKISKSDYSGWSIASPDDQEHDGQIVFQVRGSIPINHYLSFYPRFAEGTSIKITATFQGGATSELELTQAQQTWTEFAYGYYIAIPPDNVDGEIRFELHGGDTQLWSYKGKYFFWIGPE